MGASASDKAFIKRIFFGLIFVVFIQTIIVSLNSVVDNIFIEYYIQGNASAAKSIANSFINISTIFVSMVALGVEAKCTLFMAKADKEKSNKYYTMGIFWALFFGVIFMLIGTLLSDYIAKGLIVASGKELGDDLITNTSKFIRGYFALFPFISLSTILFPLCNIDGGKKLSFIALSATFIFNIVFDYLFIVVLHKDLFYLSLATGLSFTVALIILSIHLLSKRKMLELHIKSFNWRIGFDLLRRGTVAGNKLACAAIMHIVATYVILSYNGVDALAMWNIADSVFIVFTGLINAMSTVGCELERVYEPGENVDCLNEILHMLVKFSLIFVVILCGIYVGMVPLVIKSYAITDPIKKELLWYMLGFRIVSLPFMSLSLILIVFANYKRANVVYLFSRLIYPLVISLVCGLITQEIKWYIIGLSLSEIMTPLTYVLYVLIRKRKINLDVKDMCFFKKDFGYSQEDFMVFKVTNINDVLTYSSKVIKFCDNHGIDLRRKNVLASCVEEIALLYLMADAGDKEKRRQCQLKVFCKNKDNLMLKMTIGNSKYIKDEQEKIFLEDPSRNISYKMILGMAKKIEYTRLMDINNYYIVI